MKVISTVINPIPDDEGYHIFECNDCGHLFLMNPHDLANKDEIYCPFCGQIGGLLSFTTNIRNKIFQKRPLNLPEIPTESKEETETPVSIEDIKDLLENLDKEDMDVEVFEYGIDEIMSPEDFIKYEMICCEKTIKIPMESYKKVHYCAFCNAEILLNINE